MIDPKHLTLALSRAWEPIAGALGEDRPAVEYELINLLRELALAEPAAQGALVAAIVALLQPHPPAYAALLAALRAVEGTPTKGVSLQAPSAPAVLAAEASARRGGVPAGSQAIERYTKFPIFFGTDRGRSGADDDQVDFGGTRGELCCGVAEVSVPDDARMGRVERPRWWRLEFRQNPNRHLVVHSARLLATEAFAARARETLADARRKEALVFIHGYRVAFRDALLGAAQLAYDLHFEGLAAFYSWPSEGALASYTVDEANVMWSRPHFLQFLQLVRERSGATAVHLVAHSMGTRLLVDSLAGLSPAVVEGQAALNEVVLAAPDIDAATFKDQTVLLQGKAQRYTLYASSGDRALMASKTVHKYPRAGQSGLDLVVTSTVDTVDASAVDTSLLGHSYYAENRSVLSDLFNLIRHRHAPGDRGLRERDLYGERYWAFRS